jgi:hypothetical protein
MSVRVMTKAAARPAVARTRNGETLQPCLDDSAYYDHMRFVRGLLFGLGASVLLWAALAAAGYGVYLLVTAL